MLCSPLTDGHTHTHTKVTTEGTLSGFQEFYLQPIIKDRPNKHISTLSTHPGNQYWLLSDHGEMRKDEGCLDYSGGKVLLEECHGLKGNQLWEYTSQNRLMHTNSHKCLTIQEKNITMIPCTGNGSQMWAWRRRTPS